MKVKFLDLQKEYRVFKKDIAFSLKRLFTSQAWILGKEVGEFEEKVSKYLKSKFAIGVSSGTDALVLALRALAIKIHKQEFFTPKQEIIVPSFTFVASAESIIRAGATPVFVDVSYEDFLMNPSLVEKAVTKNTVGILIVHLFGLPVQMKGITRLAKRHKLFVVEDCAQSFGARFDNGVYTGTAGDCGCFSFFPTKNLGGYGDGGMVVTQDNAVFKILQTLRNHGGKNKYDICHIGYNARLDTFQAQILLIKLDYVKSNILKRRSIARIYNAGLKGLERNLILPAYSPAHTFNQYTLKVLSARRDALKEHLKKKGIDTQVYYPVPLHTMGIFKKYAKINACVNTEKLKNEVLSLPSHPFLGEKEVRYVVECVRGFFK